MKQTMFRFSPNLLIVAAGLALAACGGGSDSAPQQQDMATTAAEQESPLQELEMPRTPAPEGARVYFTNISDGDTVTSPLTLQFGAENIEIAKAGTFEPATGHHHLLIDTEVPPVSQPLPADSNHVHFGKGQLETVVELEPGSHTLQLILGDGNHVPHEPPVLSEQITIIVE